MRFFSALLFFLCQFIGVNNPDLFASTFQPEDSIRVESLAEQNLERAMSLLDEAVTAHFIGSEMAMARFYNPYTKNKSEETGSVWMYSAAIEAVNAVLHSLKVQKEHGDESLYHENFQKYADLLEELYENIDFYEGTFTLSSYTQTQEWSVYGVNRGRSKGTAKVEGIENVYDDQMWLVRELLESYKITNNPSYLEKAEYLTAYVLDGWDTTRDEDGNERGGITWGPGYVTKHSCSNGPMISPLVWLHEIYEGKNDQITQRFIDPNDKITRRTKEVTKSDYYLEFAKKVYDWQKEKLLGDEGVYVDMMGGCTPGKPQTEIINGVEYRVGISCKDAVGTEFTYNSGTMLSGAADLYRATGEKRFLKDAKKLADASFKFFTKLDQTVPGYYSYEVDGFRNWFNGVLMRAFVDIYPSYSKSSKYIGSFQDNLDYGYSNFLYEGFLPTDLLKGWKSDQSENQMEGMFSFTFAAEYAVLSRYEIEK